MSRYWHMSNYHVQSCLFRSLNFSWLSGLPLSGGELLGSPKFSFILFYFPENARDELQAQSKQNSSLLNRILSKMKSHRRAREEIPHLSAGNVRKPRSAAIGTLLINLQWAWATWYSGQLASCFWSLSLFPARTNVHPKFRIVNLKLTPSNDMLRVCSGRMQVIIVWS